MTTACPAFAEMTGHGWITLQGWGWRYYLIPYRRYWRACGMCGARREIPVVCAHGRERMMWHTRPGGTR